MLALALLMAMTDYADDGSVGMHALYANEGQGPVIALIFGTGSGVAQIYTHSLT